MMTLMILMIFLPLLVSDTGLSHRIFLKEKIVIVIITFCDCILTRAADPG